MKSKLVLLAFVAIGLFFGVRADAQSYAITNAKIVTVSGTTIDKGTVVIRNGLIESVGAGVTPPADAQVFDANGLTVYPGFIDALTSLGLATARPVAPGGGGQAAATAAAQPSTSNSNYPTGLRPEDEAVTELRSGESQFDAIRNAGITTVLTTGRSGIFNGRSVVINLAGDCVSGMVIKDPFAEHVSFATLGATYPQSLLGTFAAIRQIFYDAQRLQEMQKMYAANPKGMKRPDADRSLEALFPAINGQMPVVFNANTEVQIKRSLGLLKELNLKGIIAGGQEAWKVADLLKAQNVPVLLSLNFPKRTTASNPDADPDTLETLRFRAETPKGAAKLATAGVKFAFQSGAATSIGDFFTNAGKAVDGGLSKDAAIRAMTLGSAQILGVDDRLGSIDPGKIANVVVVKGDLFGTDKYVTHVFVDGKYYEQKELPKRDAKPADGGATPAGNIPNIGGSYAITIEIPGQSLAATLNFIQQGNSFTGTLVSQLGTSQIKDGKVTADGFTHTASVEFGGTSLEIAVKGKVTGNQIAGSVDTPQGTVAFSGTKNP